MPMVTHHRLFLFPTAGRPGQGEWSVGRRRYARPASSSMRLDRLERALRQGIPARKGQIAGHAAPGLNIAVFDAGPRLDQDLPNPKRVPAEFALAARAHLTGAGAARFARAREGRRLTVSAVGAGHRKGSLCGLWPTQYARKKCCTATIIFVGDLKIGE